MEGRYILVYILVASVVTWILRAGPFLFFKNREIPDNVHYLGDVMPPTIMAILVIYMMKDQLVSFNIVHELLSLLVVLIVHLRKRSMILSMAVGTFVYMVLIRL